MCRSQLMLVVNQCSNQEISAMNPIISDSVAYDIKQSFTNENRDWKKYELTTTYKSHRPKNKCENSISFQKILNDFLMPKKAQ